MLHENPPSASHPGDSEVLLRHELAEHRSAFEATAQMISRPFIETLEILEQGVRGGGKLLLFGNGGSAADAQHIAAELIIRYKADRAAISAIALTTDSSALTACGNDLGFDALIVVPSSVTARIQEMHITIGHVLCKALEQRLGLV